MASALAKSVMGHLREWERDAGELRESHFRVDGRRVDAAMAEDVCNVLDRQGLLDQPCRELLFGSGAIGGT